MAEESGQEKTEEPTPKRLRDARGISLAQKNWRRQSLSWPLPLRLLCWATQLLMS